MRLLGRILLLIAGGVLCVNSAIVMYNIITNYNSIGWDKMFTTSNGIVALISLIVAGIQILIGLPALLSGIFNHCGFWTTIFALILGAISVFEIIFFATKGIFSTGDWQLIVELILIILIPIIYFLGSIFIRFKKK